MTEIRFKDVTLALEARDPEVWKAVMALAQTRGLQPQEEANTGEEQAQAYRMFLGALGSWEFQDKSEQEQWIYRQSTLKALEEEGVLPDRLLLHRVVTHLWQSDGVYEREQLLHIVATCPIAWGPWKAIKMIFKEAEALGDFEMLGAISARLDSTRAGWESTREVTSKTMTYMVRRGWRALRRLGTRFPAKYPDAAVEFLRFYPDHTTWDGTWIANHIMFHQSGQYSAGRFWSTGTDLVVGRAHAWTWKRSPRPLFTLLERAQSERARAFAIESLKSDFRTRLREVEVEWVRRLMLTQSATTHEFATWLLEDVPRFEQATFGELGLQAAVIGLLESPSRAAAEYAVSYVKTHARGLELGHLLRLINGSHAAVRSMAQGFLEAKDPQKEVGLWAWTSLLGSPHGHVLAQKALVAHFGAAQMTPEWFGELLRSSNKEITRWAMLHLPKVHAPGRLGVGYFAELVDDTRTQREVALWALGMLEKHAQLREVPTEFWRRSLLRPQTSSQVRTWLGQDKVTGAMFGIEFWRWLATLKDWQESAWVDSLQHSELPWAHALSYSEDLGALARRLLGDVRQFAPKEVGVEWLLGLATRSEESVRQFASEYMIRAFGPADFAPTPQADAPAAAVAPKAATVDLGGQSFMFTGELATMSRKEAQDKVTGAGGANASGVTGSLDYLVVGDKGSALFGQGKKGAKIVKAEKLQAQGKGIKVISETAFLQMLVLGAVGPADEGAVGAGCERLWAMATGPKGVPEPLRQFAMRYLLTHHQVLGPRMTDRQVDPGMEVPREFLSWERARPLFSDERRGVRTFGIELGMVELARWSPPLRTVVELCEQPYQEVTEFFGQALLAPALKENEAFRLGREHVDEAGVYRFCDSADGDTRQLGMALIARYPDLAQPEALWRLTQSPDRQVRAFVIRTIWSLYRDQGITMSWAPGSLEARFGAPKTSKEYEKYEAGGGAKPRPGERPASAKDLSAFFRRMLFEIPPARPGKTESKGSGRTISAREAKLWLIEVMRDLAVEDLAFAQLLAPLVREFMHSRGRSEREASLVALVQLHHAHQGQDFLAGAIDVVA